VRAPTRSLLALPLALAIAGCVAAPATDKLLKEQPQLLPLTDISRALRDLPPPARPVPIAVYDFGDQTGQHKPNETFAEYSTAVTQGAVSMLMRALSEAGGGRWFTLVERENVDNLLRERQIIRTVRDEYRRPDGQPLPDVLDPLLYPGVLVMGGVTAYESNTLTGGAGARYMGIGGNTDYRLDSVTIDLRVVSVRNGRVFSTVSASKSIYSVLLQAGIFKIFGTNNLLEAEVGYTRNEPSQLAVRQAIEKAVYGMVLEGSLSGLWQFADAASGKRVQSTYLAERNGDAILASAAPAGEISEVPQPAGPAAPGVLQDERQLIGPAPAPVAAPLQSGSSPSGPLPSGAAQNVQRQLQQGGSR
jgi:curli production assembly/transport component CsgG